MAEQNGAENRYPGRAENLQTPLGKHAGRRVLAGIAVIIVLVSVGFGLALVRSLGGGTGERIRVAVTPVIYKDVEDALKRISETSGTPKPVFDLLPLPRAGAEERIRKADVDLGVLLDTDKSYPDKEHTPDGEGEGLSRRDPESNPDLERIPAGAKAFFFFTPLFSPKNGLSLGEARRILQSDDRLPAISADGTAGCSASLYGDEILMRGSFEDIPLGFRPLAVEGVMPTAPNVKEGKYPAVFPVELVVKKAPRSVIRRLADEVFRTIVPSKRRISEVKENLGHALRSSMVPDFEAVLISAVGDVMLSRRVGTLMEAEGDDYPFTEVTPLFADSDLVVANLESPIGTTGRPIPNKMIWFRAKPSAASALNRAGVDVVCLANNHILDYDTENLLETMDLLERAGIQYFGAGRNLEEARRPLIEERYGIRIGFLGYSEFARPGLYWSKAYPRSFDATPTRPGCAPLDETFLEEDIRRTSNLCDFLVVMIHWGAEDTNVPKPFIVDQRKIARLALESGADVVLGTHPHALQGLEIVGKGLCAYSLGNFVMDQKREIQKESVILNMYVTRSGLSGVDLHPAYIEECKPRILKGERASRLLMKLREISEVLTGGVGRGSAGVTADNTAGGTG